MRPRDRPPPPPPDRGAAGDELPPREGAEEGALLGLGETLGLRDGVADREPVEYREGVKCCSVARDRLDTEPERR